MFVVEQMKRAFSLQTLNHSLDMWYSIVRLRRWPFPRTPRTPLQLWRVLLRP